MAGLFQIEQRRSHLFGSAQTVLIPACDVHVTRALNSPFSRLFPCAPRVVRGWPAFCSTMLDSAQLPMASRYTHMSISALVSRPGYGNVRMRLLREGPHRESEGRAVRALRPWSEVPVAGALVQTTTASPAHIRRWHLFALVVAAIAAHMGVVWYANHFVAHEPAPKTTELNIEIVRPPKPPEPSKPEPPKARPPQVPPKQARVLPRIQQSDPLPQAV